MAGGVKHRRRPERKHAKGRVHEPGPLPVHSQQYLQSESSSLFMRPDSIVRLESTTFDPGRNTSVPATEFPLRRNSSNISTKVEWKPLANTVKLKVCFLWTWLYGLDLDVHLVGNQTCRPSSSLSYMPAGRYIGSGKQSKHGKTARTPSTLPWHICPSSSRTLPPLHSSVSVFYTSQTIDYTPLWCFHTPTTQLKISSGTSHICHGPHISYNIPDSPLLRSATAKSKAKPSSREIKTTIHESSVKRCGKYVYCELES
ncbi:hypothetical protein EDC01DRAFT_632636 [Geopyxis carbonaria]|nr:hypothetical protein EDC01DRAFT_632636 [Geopyxis carbonaria]